MLIVSLRAATPARGFALGLLYGLVGFGLTLSWVLLFGTLAWSALTFLAALSVALFGAAFPLVRRVGRPFLTALGAAALWTSLDWLRGLWPLGGFTWGSLGVSQVANPITVRLAVVAGVFGVTFAVAFAAALLAKCERRRAHDPGRLRRSSSAAALLGPGSHPVRGGRRAGHRRRGDPGGLPRRRPWAVPGGGRRRRDETQPGPSQDVERGPSRSRDLGESALDPGSLTIMDEVRATIADVGVPVVSGATSADIRSTDAGDGASVQPGRRVRRRGSGGRRLPEDPPRPVRRVHPLEADRGVDLRARADRVRAHTGGAGAHADGPGSPSVRDARSASRTASPRWTASSSGRARSSSSS